MKAQSWIDTYLKPDPVSNLSPQAINALKGFLILSIVYGHMRSFVGNNDLFTAIYSYHVAAFLILPFLYPISRLSLGKARDWGVRYMVPFYIFFCAYLCLRVLFLDKPEMQDIGFALITMTQQSLSDAVAGSVIWFLPALFLMRLSMAIVVPRIFQGSALVIIAVIGLHFTAGYIPRDIAKFVPLSAVNIMYLFAIGVLLRLCINISFKATQPWLLSMGAFWLLFFFAQISLIVIPGWRIDIAGFYLPEITNPVRLFWGTILLVSVFLAILKTPGLTRSKVLQRFGEHSFVIFLVHQPLIFMAWKVTGKMTGNEAMANNAIWLSIPILFFVMAVSALISYIIWKLRPIRIILLPKSCNEIRNFFCSAPDESGK